MKVVITSKGTDWDSEVDPRFGRAEYLFIFDEEKDQTESFDNTDIQNMAHGAGPQTAKLVFEMGAKVIITGNGPGGNATDILQKTDLKIFTGAQGMTLKEAYKAYQDGKLTKF